MYEDMFAYWPSFLMVVPVEAIQIDWGFIYKEEPPTITIALPFQADRFDTTE